MSTCCNVIAIKNHNIKLHAHEKVTDVVFYTGNINIYQYNKYLILKSSLLNIFNVFSFSVDFDGLPQ